MCASYGLGGGREPLPDDLAPMSDPASLALLAEWARSQNGSAKITGTHARNLNPVIHSPDGERVVDLAWWWLWRGREKLEFSAFNSKVEKLTGRAWKGAFQRRGLLPATWYVEKGRTFALPDGALFGIAAIMGVGVDPDGQRFWSYSMVTRPAVGEAAETWNRMPLVLPRELHDEWLDPERPGDEALCAEVQHASEEISEAMTERGGSR